jgi:iron complex transport system substrate-binding protein
MLKFINSAILLIVTLISLPGVCSAESVRAYKRIISITPATTEILFELGLDDSVIAVSSYCAWPVQAKHKEKIGSFSNPNIEKIIMLKPDLVLLTGMEQENFQAILSSIGIEYISVDPKDIDDLMYSIEKIGFITGTEKKAKAINENIRNALKEIQVSVSGRPASEMPRVYMEIWHDPVMSPGSESFVDDMIQSAGGINITADLKRAYSRVDPEQIISRNPDKIILAYMKPDIWVKENFRNRPGWSGMKAVKAGNIYAAMDPDIILRPGPRVAQGLIELHKIFYEK